MTWRDVTAECEWEDGELRHHDGDYCQPVTEPAYRLTKISGPLQPHVALIVEKQA